MGHEGRLKKRRVWPAWLRVVVATLFVLGLFKAYAGWYWHERVGRGPGVWFSPTSAYVGMSSAHAQAVEYLVQRIRIHLPGVGPISRGMPWALAYSIATVGPAALFSVFGFAALTRRYGAPSPDQPRCRRCGYFLRGLSRPQCPECGERV